MITSTSNSLKLSMKDTRQLNQGTLPYKIG